MRPAEPPRRHCQVCDQEVYRGLSGFGPWCELYTRERRRECRAAVAYELAKAIDQAEPEQAAAMEAMVEARFGVQWRMEL